MTLWIILTINSIAFAGLLFLLSAGFSLIFGLMRIPNLTHGALFMLGAYFGVTFLRLEFNFWVAAILSAVVLGVIGALIERLLLRRLAGQELAQVLVTLGLAFIIADVCLLVCTGGKNVVVEHGNQDTALVADNALHFHVHFSALFLVQHGTRFQ